MIRTGAQVHMIITYHSAFLLLKSSGNGVPKESLSHNAFPSCCHGPRANKGLQEPPGTFGGFCRLLEKTLGGWAALGRAGKSAKACAGTGNKARAGPLFTYTMIFKSRSRRTVVIFFSFY